MRGWPLMLMLAACSRGQDLPEMVELKPGSFTMGAPADAGVQQGKPQRQVALKGFRIAATQVTFAQYDAFARAAGRRLPQDDGLGRGERPAINIDRADMLAYIAWLNRGDPSGGYRLPSEAEWEYAARAGTTTAFYWGEEPDPKLANTRSNVPPDIFPYTSPVRSFPPNPWGLYDMAGNVWEMTADCLCPDHTGAAADGVARTAPGCRIFVLKGGDYSSAKRGQKPSARAAADQEFRSTSLGFRVAQDVR